MAKDEQAAKQEVVEPDPNSSPFELPPIAGIPFKKNSEEARAIREVIEEMRRERAAADADR